MNRFNSGIRIMSLIAAALVLAGCSAASGGDSNGNSTQAEASRSQQTANTDRAEAPDTAGDASTATSVDTEPAQSVPSDTVATRAPMGAAAAASVCARCGTISAIVPIQRQTGNAPPEFVGTILGGVAGALIGQQIGSGSGKTIATIVGAVGGALAGHEIQQRVTSKRYYRVTVRMDAGGARTITVPGARRIFEGMRVRVKGGNIILM